MHHKQQASRISLHGEACYLRLKLVPAGSPKDGPAPLPPLSLVASQGLTLVFAIKAAVVAFTRRRLYAQSSVLLRYTALPLQPSKLHSAEPLQGHGGCLTPTEQSDRPPCVKLCPQPLARSMPNI